MIHTLLENSHAVLLPAFAGTTLSEQVKRFLDSGGCSILAGETRDEYVARRMSSERMRNESAATISALAGEASRIGGDVLVAVDQEIGGICRLHKLVPPFPDRAEIADMDTDAFVALSETMARAAKSMGVNCFLGPIMDVVTGRNPWLEGRTWSSDPVTIARIGGAYIRGLQAHGVAATAKHFPGYPHLELDPAVDELASMDVPLPEVEKGLLPFAVAVESDVAMIMTGPAMVEAYDQHLPASYSPHVVNVLREELGFQGVVLSDDLDSRATLRGRTSRMWRCRA